MDVAFVGEQVQLLASEAGRDSFCGSIYITEI